MKSSVINAGTGSRENKGEYHYQPPVPARILLQKDMEVGEERATAPLLAVFIFYCIERYFIILTI